MSLSLARTRDLLKSILPDHDIWRLITIFYFFARFVKPDIIRDLILNFYKSTIQIRPLDPLHEQFLEWLHRKHKIEHSQNLVAETIFRPAPNDAAPAEHDLRWEPSAQLSRFDHSNRSFWIRRATKEGDIKTSARHVDPLEITCMSRSSAPIQKLIETVKYDVKNSDDAVVLVRNARQFSKVDPIWSAPRKERQRSFSMLVVPFSDQIRKKVQEFMKGDKLREWYAHLNQTHKCGLFMYGQPGTGKSSMAMLLAWDNNLEVFELSLSTLSGSNLEILWEQLPSRCMVLINDVDSAFTEEQTCNIGLDVLLKLIDAPANGRVLVLTANDPKRIPTKLTRNGRFDGHYEFPRLDFAIAKELFCVVYPDACGLSEDFAGLWMRLRPDSSQADIKAHFTRFPYNAAGAVADLRILE
ncbi:MAG: hypothetical protein Q9162_007630 [Coniocarpon cinnabarinum]